MASTPSNVVLIMADEHRPDAMGCAGHPHVETPHLDELAASGTRFTNAFCPSPLCAPCRASFVTGRYVHEIGAWDNASSYDGEPATWGEWFADRDVHTATVGKLDFQPGVQGFPEQLLPGYRESPDVHGLERDPPIVREHARDRITAAGPSDGPSGGERADIERTDRAIEWLEEHADEDGWILWVNLSKPHFALVSQYYDRYADVDELPIDYPAADDHPVLEELRDHFQGRDLDPETLRRTRRAYYGLCSTVDEQVGRVMAALDRLGSREDTMIAYTADHGEPLGDHETWWKCKMYEPSVGIPLVVDGPGVRSATVDAPVSLLDLVPTMADALDVEGRPSWRGVSQWSVVTGERPPDRHRHVFAEYHAHGTSRGMFMLRDGRYKYVYYPERPAQLFDVREDPDELENLATDPDYAPVIDRLRVRLEEQVDPDPDAVDRRARREQRQKRERPVAEWWAKPGA